jgi:hypothetical protein
MHKEALTITGPDAYLLTMFIGWTMAWYGVHRRNFKGTLVALGGLGLSLCALTGIRDE